MLSYATVAEADEYHNARQTAAQWDDYTPTQKQQRLVSASDLIDRLFAYKGKPENDAQARAFPRLLPQEVPDGALFRRLPEYGAERQAVLPESVKQACCELALLSDISGSLKNAAKVQNLGGVLVKAGDCKGDDKDWSLAVFAAQRLLAPLIDRRGFVGRG